MNIKRDIYIQQLESKSWNGKGKIITGIRRCGNSINSSPAHLAHLAHCAPTYLKQIGIKEII